MKYVELFPSSASSRKAEIDTLIKNDLDYAVKYWQQSTFDLWEEVQGNSFFTSVSQFHALALGSAYFKTSDATRSASYLSTSKQIRCYTDSNYWNGSAYLSNINNNAGRSGLDTNSVIAAQLFPTAPSVAYTSDPCASGFFSPCSDRMLASTYRVVESFRGVYAINSAREAAGSKALAIGRYKEDV
jgi:glucoamylase